MTDREIKETPMYCVVIEGGNMPSSLHEDTETAQKECERLIQKEKKTGYVVRVNFTPIMKMEFSEIKITHL